MSVAPRAGNGKVTVPDIVSRKSQATSHLDVRRESLINESVRQLPLTRVVVAPRPQTIASADRVVVLEGGAVRQDLRVSTVRAGSPPRATGE